MKLYSEGHFLPGLLLLLLLLKHCFQVVSYILYIKNNLGLTVNCTYRGISLRIIVTFAAFETMLSTHHPIPIHLQLILTKSLNHIPLLMLVQLAGWDKTVICCRYAMCTICEWGWPFNFSEKQNCYLADFLIHFYIIILDGLSRMQDLCL